ncbi:MAG: glycosyltransferase family 4 protein [Metallibacterium sp.]
MTKHASQVVMVGTFPPPMHGMAAVNAVVSDRLLVAGARFMVLNTAPASLDRGILQRLGRLPRVMRGLARLAGTRHLQGTALYIGVSGGVGKIYDLAFLLLARARHMRVFVHHHSFAYLHERRRLASALVRAAGRHATHITQSEGMAERLCTLYGAADVSAVSNAVFLVGSTEPARVQPRSKLHVLGFLGNIAAEKGIFEFLDLMAVLRQSGLPVHGKIAGPFQDAATERQVRQRLPALPNVVYVGPQYGAEKDVFLEEIDALVFPTLYANEAEPLVIHEAMQHGLPVIAYGRGCIPEVVMPECGCVIPPEEPFVPAASTQIDAWMRAPEMFQAASVAAAARFATLQQASAQRWAMLQAKIIGAAP